MKLPLVQGLIVHFFPQPLARQGLLDPFLFTRLHVESMFLDILDDVFLLHFALEAPKCAFQAFSILKNNFRQ